MTRASDPRERRLGDLLQDIASDDRMPGAGVVAAIVGAMGAALVGSAARASKGSWIDAGGAAAQADVHEARLMRLAGENAEAYAEALAALRLQGRGDDGWDGDVALGRALARAGELPAQIAEGAADVAVLGALAARSVQPALRADLVAATALCEGAARAAAHLVAVNLAVPADGEQRQRAAALVAAAEAARRDALALGL